MTSAINCRHCLRLIILEPGLWPMKKLDEHEAHCFKRLQRESSKSNPSSPRGSMSVEVSS